MRSWPVNDSNTVSRVISGSSGWPVELIDPRRDLELIHVVDQGSFFQTWTNDTLVRELKKYPFSRIYVIRVAGVGALGYCAARRL